MADKPTEHDAPGDSPPVYEVLPVLSAQAPASGSSNGASSDVAAATGQMSAHNDPLSQFCVANRDLIAPALEERLRAARYLPKDNPDEISADYWRSAYGVDFFDLKRLKEAYERGNGTGQTSTPTGKATYSPRKGDAE